jgi:methyl-accepting chemotaxis protein
VNQLAKNTNSTLSLVRDVAVAVRSFAGRSALAAKDIKHLIQDSVNRVEDGSVAVTQSGALQMPHNR